MANRMDVQNDQSLYLRLCDLSDPGKRRRVRDLPVKASVQSLFPELAKPPSGFRFGRVSLITRGERPRNRQGEGGWMFRVPCCRV